MMDKLKLPFVGAPGEQVVSSIIALVGVIVLSAFIGVSAVLAPLFAITAVIGVLRFIGPVDEMYPA